MFVVSDAINSARQSNATDLKGMQQKLDKMNTNIAILEKKLEALKKENLRLR